MYSNSSPFYNPPYPPKQNFARPQLLSSSSPNSFISQPPNDMDMIYHPVNQIHAQYQIQGARHGIPVTSTAASSKSMLFGIPRDSPRQTITAAPDLADLIENCSIINQPGERTLCESCSVGECSLCFQTSKNAPVHMIQPPRAQFPGLLMDTHSGNLDKKPSSQPPVRINHPVGNSTPLTQTLAAAPTRQPDNSAESRSQASQIMDYYCNKNEVSIFSRGLAEKYLKDCSSLTFLSKTSFLEPQYPESEKPQPGNKKLFRRFEETSKYFDSNDEPTDNSESSYHHPAGRKFTPSPNQYDRCGYQADETITGSTMELPRFKDVGKHNDRMTNNSVFSSGSNIPTSSMLDHQDYIYDKYRQRYANEECEDDDRWSFSQGKDETLMAERFFDIEKMNRFLEPMPPAPAWNKPKGVSPRPDNTNSSDANGGIPMKLFDVEEIKSLTKLL